MFPADTGGCGYYRLIWPANILRAAGHDVKLIHPDVKRRLSGGMDANNKLVSVIMPKDADVVVMQRVSSKFIADAIKIMRDNGVAVVLDIDDDMKAIHQGNPAWAALHPRGTSNTEEYNWDAAQLAYDSATLVTTSTDALLKRYASHGRGVVLRNVVPEVLLEFEHVDNETIGWPGEVRTHPDDPHVVGPAMAKLQREGYTFRIIGSPRGTKEAFMLDKPPASAGPTTIDGWPRALATLGVGIAPLNDTRFNEAKSWLKMLELAAVGVPCIGSPRAEYRRLNAMGVGLLADNPRQWYRHAHTLLTNPQMRREMSEAGRAAVAELTIQKQAWRWMEAWERAYEIQRGKRPQATVLA